MFQEWSAGVEKVDLTCLRRRAVQVEGVDKRRQNSNEGGEGGMEDGQVWEDCSKRSQGR